MHVTGLCTVGSVWNIAGIYSERSNNISCAFFFQCSRRRLKFYGKICRSIARKSRRRGTEINALVDGQVFLRIQSVFTENVFKDHFRHAALATAENFLSFQVFPFEVRHFFPCHKEVSGTLSKLRKVHCRVSRTFLVCINGCFCSHKSDICFTGDQSSQNFICTKARHQCQIQTFLCKISLFDCHILRRIENRMRYFIQCNLRKLLLFSIFLRSKYSHRQCRHRQNHCCCQ